MRSYGVAEFLLLLISDLYSLLSLAGLWLRILLVVIVLSEPRLDAARVFSRRARILWLSLESQSRGLR